MQAVRGPRVAMQPEAHITTRDFLAVARAIFAVVITKKQLTNILDFHFDYFRFVCRRLGVLTAGYTVKYLLLNH